MLTDRTMFEGTPIKTALDIYNVQDVRALEDLQRAKLAKHRLVKRPSGMAAQAYVSENRWVADCVCGAGMAVVPGDPEIVCLDCGLSYSVEMPDHPDKAEAVLVKRAPINRHWFPQRGETVDDLERENAEHGVGC